MIARVVCTIWRVDVHQMAWLARPSGGAVSGVWSISIDTTAQIVVVAERTGVQEAGRLSEENYSWNKETTSSSGNGLQKPGSSCVDCCIHSFSPVCIHPCSIPGAHSGVSRLLCRDLMPYLLMMEHGGDGRTCQLLHCGSSAFCRSIEAWTLAVLAEQMDWHLYERLSSSTIQNTSEEGNRAIIMLNVEEITIQNRLEDDLSRMRK